MDRNITLNYIEFISSLYSIPIGFSFLVHFVSTYV